MAPGKGRGEEDSVSGERARNSGKSPGRGTHTTAIEARSFSKNCDIVHTSIKTAEVCVVQMLLTLGG